MEGIIYIPPVPDIIGRISIFLPPQSYMITCMEREYNIICNIRDAAATVRG